MDYNKALLEYLSQFVSDDRKELFNTILSNRTKHFTIVLEDIFQPHNANAVIRSADCFGIQEIHTIETINEFLPSRGVSKGAIKWIDRTSYSNYQEAYKKLRKEGYQIVATSPHAQDCNIDDFDVTKKSAIFFGAEKAGISEETKQEADVFLQIPMNGFTESLNISVSAAIIMQNITSKLRNGKNKDWGLSRVQKEQIYLDWCKKSIGRIDIHLQEFDKKWKAGLNK